MFLLFGVRKLFWMNLKQYCGKVDDVFNIAAIAVCEINTFSECLILPCFTLIEYVNQITNGDTSFYIIVIHFAI